MSLFACWTLVPGWYQLWHCLRLACNFFWSETEQVWQGISIWKFCVWVSQLVEVWVEKGSKWSWSSLWIILQEGSNKVNSLFWSSVSEHFLPWEWSDLWETVLFVVRVHCLDLFLRRSSQNLNDFNQLIHSTFTRENWLSKHQLSNNASYRPDVN